MKKFRLIIAAILATLVLVACSPTKEEGKIEEKDKLQIVATNSILADMIEQVTQDKAAIHSIVPVGTDPHEYEPLPADIAKVTDSDLIFYNGLNLETGGNGWFAKLMEMTDKEAEEDYFVTSTGVEPMFLTEEGKETEQDPHAWLDIANGIKYVENITAVLTEKDQENKKFYEENAALYITELKKLDESAKEKFADIPEEKKLLVTSEGAFKYFSKAYGLEAAYIWEINTHNEGTPEQMSRIINRIKDSQVPVLFVETSVDHRSMESVSQETGLSIYEEIFTDSIAKKGQNGDSYYKMLEWNLDKIHAGLSSEQ